MAVGLLKLYRSPLREGEPLYALGNIDDGIFEDGNHKGDKKPKISSLMPSVLDDGRLCWDMLDTEANRALIASFMPQIENPPFTYSAGYPEDDIFEDDTLEVMADGEKTAFEAEAPMGWLKKRGSKPKQVEKK